MMQLSQNGSSCRYLINYLLQPLMDNLPAWFLRLEAPVFYKPLAYLFSKLLVYIFSSATVETCLYMAGPSRRSPYHLTMLTLDPSESHPSFALELIVVKQFLYPAILNPPAVSTPLSFANQYAFRSTGSKTPALIALLQTITDLIVASAYALALCFVFLFFLCQY